MSAKRAPKALVFSALKPSDPSAKIRAERAGRAAAASHLQRLCQDKSADARSIVNFIVGSTCGLELTNPDDKATPLMSAVQGNRLDVVQLLLTEHTPNIKAVNIHGWTALHIAALYNFSEIVKSLIENGSEVDAMGTTGCTPLHYAVSGNHISTAMVLLDLGANPTCMSNAQQTPLRIACGCDYIEMAKILLKVGLDQIDAVDNQGITALNAAVSYEHRHYNHGDDDPPLHDAPIIGNHYSMTLLLLEHGASLNIPNLQGITPLHTASGKGLVDVAKVLLANGARSDAVDSYGRTPLEHAIQNSRSETLRLLKGNY